MPFDIVYSCENCGMEEKKNVFAHDSIIARLPLEWMLGSYGKIYCFKCVYIGGFGQEVLTDISKRHNG